MPPPDTTTTLQPALNEIVAFFETISAESVTRLRELYAHDAFFKDPFNEVSGVAAIERIFTHMFSQVETPRFRVTLAMLQGEHAFLTWDFLFRMRRGAAIEQCIRGATHLRLDTAGRIIMHRDYWDAAEELYEKLPVLGSLMRVLKRAARS